MPLLMALKYVISFLFTPNLREFGIRTNIFHWKLET